MVLLFAFLIGLLAGLRSPLSWMSSPIAVGLFTLLALAELISDKLPKTPSRTAPPGLIARILLGGLSGPGVAMAGNQGMIVGALLGIVGGIVGCFGGYSGSQASGEGAGHTRLRGGAHRRCRRHWRLAVGRFTILAF